VIKYQTPDKGRIRIRLVLHLHNLHHVQVDRLGLSVLVVSADGEYGVGDICRELSGQLSVKLGSEGCVGDGDEGCSVEFRGDFEGFQELAPGLLAP
jgi:hypothetical protein